MEFIAHNVANVINRVGECRLKYDHFADVSKTLSQCRGMWIEMTLMTILPTSAKCYPPCRGCGLKYENAIYRVEEWRTN